MTNQTPNQYSNILSQFKCLWCNLPLPTDNIEPEARNHASVKCEHCSNSQSDGFPYVQYSISKPNHPDAYVTHYQVYISNNLRVVNSLYRMQTDNPEFSAPGGSLQVYRHDAGYVNSYGNTVYNWETVFPVKGERIKLPLEQLISKIKNLTPFL